MIEPKLRLLHYNDNLKTVFLHDIFKKITRKNKGNLVTNVITNSAKEGLLPQREYFDKDVANKDNTDGYYIIEEGDFVYNPRKSAEAPYGPFGRYNFSGEGIVSPLYTCLKIIDKNEINSDFLLYYFKSPAWYRYVYSNGDTGVRHDRVSIKDDTLLDMPIHIPNKDEQIKVVQLFKSIDDVIDIIKSDVLLWEEKKEGVMQKIFSREVRFKKEDGSDYPEWKSNVFKDVFEILKNNTLSRAELNYEEGYVQNMHYGDVLIKYPFVLDVKKEIIPYITDKDIAKKVERMSLKNGDVIISDTAEDETVGKATEIINLHEEILVSGLHTIPIRPVSIQFELGYLGYFINSNLYHDQLKPLMQGIKVTSISKGAIQSTMISYPCIEEQRKIVNCLLAIDETIQLKKQKLETWKTIKKGLLQQMFV